MQRFEKPVKNYAKENTFGASEVGFIHPQLAQFIRLSDSGDIQIVVNDGLAIILHAKTNSITFVADSVKFLTSDGDSIRWNNSVFNSKATDFTQPSLLPLDTEDIRSIYAGSEDYYGVEEE